MCNLNRSVCVSAGTILRPMLLSTILDAYLIFGLISSAHWGLLALFKALGVKPSGIPH